MFSQHTSGGPAAAAEIPLLSSGSKTFFAFGGKDYWVILST